jgi:hypothetical protein
LTVGTVNAPSGTGTVYVPIFLQDNTGTAIGRDKGAGLRISGVGFKVVYGASACVDTPALESGRVLVSGGVLAGQAVDIDSRLKVANTSQSWIYSAAEAHGLVPFTPASAPGDQIGRMVFNLTGCAPGTINLVVTVAGGGAALVTSDSNTSQPAATA